MTMMSPRRFYHILVVCILLFSGPTTKTAAQYADSYDQEYGQDNLYHDYAMRQQEKEAATAGYVSSAICFILVLTNCA